MNTSMILAIIVGLVVVAGVVFLFTRGSGGGSNGSTGGVQATAPVASKPDDTDVDELDDEEGTFAKDGIVFFGSNGCPACRAFRPMYYNAARAYPRRFRYMDLARLKRREFLRQHNIRAIPHVVAVKGGKVKAVFSGRRSVDSLRKFAKKNL